jgi:hypothetical protein
MSHTGTNVFIGLWNKMSFRHEKEQYVRKRKKVIKRNAFHHIVLLNLEGYPSALFATQLFGISRRTKPDLEFNFSPGESSDINFRNTGD